MSYSPNLKFYEPGNRNFGLDVVRALAISLVLLAHSGVYFVSGLNIGFFGVELFFVLSGFLIGQIVLREFKKEITFKNCGSFYLNRWLRTLPLYYLVLIVKDLIAGSFHIKHYFFVQQGGNLEFFPVSWSLAIEEWFYLLIPLLFLFNRKFLSFQTSAFILSLITVVVLTRFLFIHVYHADMDLYVRKSIPLRFDALLTGVLFSIWKIDFNSSYLKFSDKHASKAFIVLFAVTLLIYRKCALLERSAEVSFMKSVYNTVVFVLLSFSFGFFIMWYERASFKVTKDGRLIKIVTAISVLAYPVYLIHYDIFAFFVNGATFSSSWWWQGTTSLFIIACAAWVMHIFIERPIMGYRKIFIKKMFDTKNEKVLIRKV